MRYFFSPLVEPLGALWLLMALGVLALMCRRQWRSALWLGLPTLLLFIVGSTPLVEVLVRGEESRFVKAGTSKGQASVINGLPTADAVVALGGGMTDSRYDILGFAARDGASRILTAIELVRLGKARALVLGGHVPAENGSSDPDASRLQDWVVSWGCVLQAGGGRVDASGQGSGPDAPGTGPRQTTCDVTNLGACFNTHDEAIAFRYLRDRRGWTNVLLVTSALHMRRSEALFRKQGIQVVPVPADFESLGLGTDLRWSLLPSQHRLFVLYLYLHEKIGWWVYRWRGWI